MSIDDGKCCLSDYGTSGVAAPVVVVGRVRGYQPVRLEKDQAYTRRE